MVECLRLHMLTSNPLCHLEYHTTLNLPYHDCMIFGSNAAFRYMYRYMERREHTWQARQLFDSFHKDTAVPFDRPEACLRGL